MNAVAKIIKSSLSYAIRISNLLMIKKSRIIVDTVSTVPIKILLPVIDNQYDLIWSGTIWPEIVLVEGKKYRMFLDRKLIVAKKVITVIVRIVQVLAVMRVPISLATILWLYIN